MGFVYLFAWFFCASGVTDCYMFNDSYGKFARGVAIKQTDTIGQCCESVASGEAQVQQVAVNSSHAVSRIIHVNSEMTRRIDQYHAW